MEERSRQAPSRLGGVTQSLVIQRGQGKSNGVGASTGDLWLRFKNEEYECLGFESDWEFRFQLRYLDILESEYFS